MRAVSAVQLKSERAVYTSTVTLGLLVSLCNGELSQLYGLS